jgi:hypothetical protein
MARQKTGLTINVSIVGLQETLRALRNLPKDATVEMREAAQKLSTDLAKEVAAAGRAEGSQAALVSTTVKAMKDRVPVIQAGGAKKLGRNKKPAYKLLFGSEFGSNYYEQFGKPHIGNDSYWFFKTVDENQVEISAAWLEAADEIINKFST